MEAARVGDTEWPPSYAAFLGMCEEPKVKALHKPFPKLQLPDKTARERSQAVGSSTLDSLKSMFDGE